MDLDNFDMDVDNIMLLTNEHIRSRDLEEIDAKFYHLLIQDRMSQSEQAKQKRKERQDRSQRNKKQRLLLDDLGHE